MKKTIIGYPRLGEKRELKRVIEGYFKGQFDKEKIFKTGKEIRKNQWELLKNKEIDYIPTNDFSYYDIFLDTVSLLGAIPKKYKDLNLNEIDTYFALAKGYQNDSIDIKAFPMKKWFNTNYHYLVPQLDKKIDFKLNIKKLEEEYLEAKELGIESKPTIIGPLTFLNLSNITEGNKEDYLKDIIKVYKNIFEKLNHLEVKTLQIDEPVLVMDLEEQDIINFNYIYDELLNNKENLNVILQTYFGSVEDIYKELVSKDFFGIGLDLVEGSKNIELIKNYFPQNKILFAGVVNGKNIWRNDYKKSLDILNEIKKSGVKNIVISSSCSLLHVPYTLKNESELKFEYKKYLAFAEEKLDELNELSILYEDNNYKNNKIYLSNIELLKEKREHKEFHFKEIRNKVNKLKEKDFNRKTLFENRIKEQKNWLKLPIFPTTTIGSFPQTLEVRKARREFKKGLITENEYITFIKEKIKNIVEIQEELDLDVLVHGEYERNDMVEYFGENLTGFLFTQNGWVQSYGTRGVKPPIIFGDVKREKSITVSWSTFAQSLTKKPMKGMLTGPITIQNWSFVREDLPLKDIAYQIGLAIQEEVLDLEKNNIKIIQIDEAALREKLPLRKSEWIDYLDWAIKSFRLCVSKVENTTQIHTHMCYSEFKDIMKEIKAMDADVITIEAAKSDLSLLEFIKKENYDKEIGPGVYDIHSPRVPNKKELKGIIKNFFEYISADNIWVNPDCGLKTRGEKETFESLKNMVEATKEIRKEYKI